MKKDSQCLNQNTTSPNQQDYTIDNMNDALELTNELTTALSPRKTKKTSDKEKTNK